MIIIFVIKNIIALELSCEWFSFLNVLEFIHKCRLNFTMLKFEFWICCSMQQAMRLTKHQILSQ